MEMQIPGSCSRTVISIFLILEKLNIFNLRLRRFLIKCSSFFFIILDLQRSCKVMAVSFHEHFIQLLLALSSSLTTQQNYQNQEINVGKKILLTNYRLYSYFNSFFTIFCCYCSRTQFRVFYCLSSLCMPNFTTLDHNSMIHTTADESWP